MPRVRPIAALLADYLLNESSFDLQRCNRSLLLGDPELSAHLVTFAITLLLNNTHVNGIRKVAGTVFRVHKYFFERESEYFREGFRAAGPQEDGQSDQAAFRLDDVKISEFERLLWVFYNPQYMYDEQPIDHWITILDLATRWEFPSVRDLAVRQLQKLDMKPVERIITYDKYNLDKSLLLPAYILLCKQPSRSIDDGKRLGMPTVLKINEAREYAQRSAAEQGCPSPTSADAEDRELVEILKDVFDLS